MEKMKKNEKKNGNKWKKNGKKKPTRCSVASQRPRGSLNSAATRSRSENSTGTGDKRCTIGISCSRVQLSVARNDFASDRIRMRMRMCTLYVCVCVYMRCMYTSHRIHMYIIHTYIHIHMHTYIHTYIYTRIHTYIHTYTHAYIHTFTHTYIHTYIRSSKKKHTRHTRERTKWIKNTHRISVLPDEHELTAPLEYGHRRHRGGFVVEWGDNPVGRRAGQRFEVIELTRVALMQPHPRQTRVPTAAPHRTAPHRTGKWTRHN